MSEMVERVAEAIRDVNADTIGLSYTELTSAMARAAIAAMREPTVKMLMASGLGPKSTQKSRYQAMIDEALDGLQREARRVPPTSSLTSKEP